MPIQFFTPTHHTAKDTAMTNVLHFPMRKTQAPQTARPAPLPVNALQKQAPAQPNKAPDRLGTFPASIPRLV